MRPAPEAQKTPAAQKGTFRRFDGYLLLIPLLIGVAIWPLLTQSLPSTDDGALHLYRVVQLDRCLQHGELCLRWAPDFAHGYGYPGFNYYMNMPTFVAEGWHLLGLDFSPALAATYCVAFALSGWGAYLLGRDILNRHAGLVVAAAYVYAPYQFFDIFYRGNLAESWALALLPWVFWTARRAALNRRWRDIVPFALAYASLIWTHNIYVMLTSPLVGLYLLILWWQNGHPWRDLGRICAMVGLGLALSAFFWIPAFFEVGWTRYAPGLFDYRIAFLQAGELFALPPQWDLAWLNQYPPRSLGWGMLILVVVGAGALLFRSWRAQDRRSQLHVPEWAFFALTLLLTAGLTLSISKPVWQVLSPLQVVQMPWRFLGLAALAGSLCAGWAIAVLTKRPGSRSPARVGTAIATILLIASTVPWTYAAPFPQPKRPGVDKILKWEYATHTIGTTSMGEFLPVWSSGIPSDPADPRLLSEDDAIAKRLDMRSLPEGATILREEYGILRSEITVETPNAFRARYNQFYFPGWQVRIDGKKVPPVILAPYGLLGFDVPAGQHRITVAPATTPLRALGNTISILGVVTAILVTYLGRSRETVVPRRNHLTAADCPEDAFECDPPQTGKTTKSRLRDGLVLALLYLILLGVKEGWIDRTENLFRAHRFDGVSIPRGRAASINWGNTLALVGYELQASAISGETLRVDLYVSPLRAVDGDFLAYARLVDEQGRLWSERDNTTPNGHRPPPSTEIWSTDVYGHWAYLTHTLPGTPPGEYWIEVGVFERDTWRGLHVLDEQGRIVQLSTRLGPVQIVSSRKPPATQDLGIDHENKQPAAPELLSLGSTLSARSLEGGDRLEVTLFWQATQRPESTYHLSLSLVADDKSLMLAEELPLGRDTHPTANWEAGEIVRSPHSLRIPAAAVPGQYILVGTLYDETGRTAGEPVQLGKLEIQPTERSFVVPEEMGQHLDASLEGFVTLLGADAPLQDVEPGAQLPVTLYWQAEQEMSSNYKVFLQVVGAEGVLAQADAVPVAWTRPTTGWVAGEVLVDSYLLEIPASASPGTYRLIAGMYEQLSLVRLQAVDVSGQALGDHVFLSEIAVR